MATPARATRRGSFLIAAGVILATAALYMLAPQILALADLGFYNQQFRLRGVRPANPQVVIVAIDEESLRALGRWPWPRSVLADLVRRLDQAGAAAIALDILLTEPETSGELRAVERLVARLGRLGAGQPIYRELERMRRQADHDRQLADAIAASDRTVLASQFTLSMGAPATAPPREGRPLKSALASFGHYGERGLFPPPHADAAGIPIPVLLNTAKALGHVTMLSDLDGTTRWELLVIEHRGFYYPSLALEAVRVAAGIDPFALRLDFGHAVTLADTSVPIDPRARVLVDYAGPTKTFPYISAASVLRGDVPVERLRDKIVFVGATAEGTYDLRVTPFSPVFPGVEKHANVAANILQRRFIIRPACLELVEAGGILLLPLVLAWVLPRLRPLTAVGAAMAIWLVFLGASHLAFRKGPGSRSSTRRSRSWSPSSASPSFAS